MKTAIITGTSSGLGEAFAKSLLDLGWKVYGISRRTNENLVAHSEFVQINIDLAKPLDTQLLTSTILEKKIDLLVNNAGCYISEQAGTWNDEIYKKTFAVNYVAPLHLLSYFAAKLASGMVISTLSAASHVGWDFYSYYGASKAALWLHMKGFAQGNPEIQCLSLHPSMIKTEMTDQIVDWTDEDRTHFMKTKDVVTVFEQLVTGVLSLPNGSSIFLHNEWENEEVVDVGANTYFYNTDTEQLREKKLC